jgi:hypothetical protein
MARVPCYRSSGLSVGAAVANERLTSATGALLTVLLALEGVTLFFLGPLLGMHMFIGLALIPPVALKLASTGYRFARYYMRAPAYRSKGPPALLFRASAPLVILSTIAVLASGVGLLLGGPSSRNVLLPIHKASFIVWIVFTGFHVLGHLPKMVSALRADYTASSHHPRAEGRRARDLALAAALIAGTFLAVTLLPHFGPWLSAAGRLD